MKVRSITIKSFKRFANVTVGEFPSTTRLVVLAGPNGRGKSSLFDGLNIWARTRASLGWAREADYYDRNSSLGGTTDTHSIPQRIIVEFHQTLPQAGTIEARKAFHLRTAYRNDPELNIQQFSKLGSALDETRFNRMIDTDAAVSTNYQRLVSDAFDEAFQSEDAGTTIGVWREKVIGELREAVKRLFPDLYLNGLGSPMRDPTFRFTKGSTSGFVYKNLSGGEKAAFDLLLDVIVQRHEYDDTVFCFDEPEAHLNPRIHGLLLKELVKLVPKVGQLWVATHSIGMLRAASDIEKEEPGSVAFIDFEGHDFDKDVQLTPVRPTRAFWANSLKVALDDLADLVAPQELIICEGNPAGPVPGKNCDHDARCYSKIFGDAFPEFAFVSGGNSHDVASDRLGIAATIPSIVKGTSVRALIDRDDHSVQDIADYARKGTSVLLRRNLQSYLYDDEVLIELCKERELPERAEALLGAKKNALADSVKRGNSLDDLKPAAPQIYLAAKGLLELTGVGNDCRAFERNVLAGLIRQGMIVFQELRTVVIDSRLPRS